MCVSNLSSLLKAIENHYDRMARLRRLQLPLLYHPFRGTHYDWTSGLLRLHDFGAPQQGRRPPYIVSVVSYTSASSPAVLTAGTTSSRLSRGFARLRDELYARQAKRARRRPMMMPRRKRTRRRFWRSRPAFKRGVLAFEIVHDLWRRVLEFV